MSKLHIEEDGIEVTITYEDAIAFADRLQGLINLAMSLSNLISHKPQIDDKIKDSEPKDSSLEESTPPKKKKKKVSDIKKEEALQEKKEEKKEEVTLDDIKKKALAIMKSGKQAQIADIIKSYEASTISEIPKDKYLEVMGQMEKLVNG